MSGLQVRRAEWESFAAENALYYICTGPEGTNESSFWQSGEDVVEHELLPVMLRHNTPRNRALELGCGVGRLAIPLARHFQAIVGLDIAAAMVSKAAEFAKRHGADNTQFIQIGDPEGVLRQLGAYSARVDFIYSMLVFQHIDDFKLIDKYVQLVRSLLSPSGVAYLQFDTRREGLLYHAKRILPDSVLPRQWRRGIRRVRRDPLELESCFGQHALKIVEQVTPRSELHKYVLKVRS